MTDEQINAAIAKVCGRKRNTNGGWYPDNGFNVGTQGIPNYCTDLNAMHEAERTLSTANMYVMEVQLKRVLSAREFYFHATASQRAEALLRALGKWEEEKPTLACARTAQLLSRAATLVADMHRQLATTEHSSVDGSIW